MKSLMKDHFHMGNVSMLLLEELRVPVNKSSHVARVLNDLSAEEKERYKADIRATNILLQGIPKDIYSLINHYTDAKDIWENVKMILEGSELTKDDRESQLYDEFEHFRQNIEKPFKETIMLPELSRFITEVKLNRGLKESNFDQLYAYLKQHKSPQSSNEPSHADNFQLDSGSSSTENLIESLSNSLALLTQSYKSYLPQTNNQLRTSSNARNKATVQDYFKDKMLLMQAQENGAVLDEEQSLFLTGEQIINFDKDVDNLPENDLALNMDHIFEADECDAFDSDVDEGPTTQTMFMTNLTSEDRIHDEAGPSYDSNTPYEVQDHDNFVNHLDEYHEVHEIQTDEQHNYVVDSDADYTSNSNIIPYDQYVEDNEDHVVQRNVSSVRNDALKSILDEMHEQGVQSRLANKQVKVVNDTLTSELARYKE
ncbi:hypothetical protein Tco_1331759, partial [Tanacetum coccineum]